MLSEAMTVTICTKLRLFQYRLMQRIIPTNIKLKIWKIKESNRCTFCESFPESIQHLFWECEPVKKLWNALVKWFKYTFEIRLQIDYVTMLFNGVNKHPKQMLNTTVLIVKYYIYSCKCQEIIPTFIPLLGKINEYYFAENKLHTKIIR